MCMSMCVDMGTDMGVYMRMVIHMNKVLDMSQGLVYDMYRHTHRCAYRMKGSLRCKKCTWHGLHICLCA